MSPRRRRPQAALLPAALLSLGLAVASGWILAGEAGPYVTAGAGQAARLASLAEGRAVVGPSRNSRSLLLDDCVVLVTSLRGLAMRSADRRAALDTCTAAATDFLATSPAYAYAALVLALTSGAAGDDAAMNAALASARRHAPVEQWLAELRVHLGEERLAALDAVNRAGHDADLALMVQTRRGIGAIARRYVALPDFRERIAAIVETLPPDQQSRFVSAIRYEMSADATARGE